MYTEAEKQIFEYKDAAGQVRLADPLEIKWRLQTLLAGKADEVVDRFYGDNPGQAMIAADKLKAAVCLVFELGQPFNAATGQGASWGCWTAALDAFLDWCEKKNQSAASLPTSPALTTEPCPAESPTSF